MLSQSDLERERYEGRLKQQRDARAALADARRQGIDEGRRQGIDEERRKNWENQIHLYERWLRRPETPKEQLRGLPAEELERLVKVLEAEVAGGLSGPS